MIFGHKFIKNLQELANDRRKMLKLIFVTLIIYSNVYYQNVLRL